MNIAGYDIALIDLYMAGAMVVVLLFELYFYLRYIRLPKNRHVPDSDSQRPKHAGDQLDLFRDDVRGVSVIVAARNEAGNLREKRLRRRNGDLHVGADVEHAVGLARDAATHAVRDGKDTCALRARDTYRRKSVCRLARLRDRDDERR